MMDFLIARLAMLEREDAEHKASANAEIERQRLALVQIEKQAQDMHQSRLRYHAQEQAKWLERQGRIEELKTLIEAFQDDDTPNP